MHSTSNHNGTALILALCGALLPSSAFGVVGQMPVSKTKTAGSFNNPAVMPLNAKAHGLSWAEWSARFWQWQFSMPVGANPIFDTADCSAGQSGKVWFLGGSSIAFETSPGVQLAQASRTCTIRPGTALFLPIVNSECSTVPGDVLPGFGTTPEELRKCAQFASTLIVPGTLSATLDNVPIRGLTQYSVTSPLFSFGPLPANNVLQFFGLNAPAGTTAQSVSEGLYLFLHPLSAGDHVLHFHAELDFGETTFIQDITYYIRVAR
jgi:hypothetical protein